MPHQLQSTEDERNAPLEDYLDRVVAPLVDDVPCARRRELRAELNAHLEALIEAHAELGATPEEAVAAAIRQFGSPRQVGKQWLREWRREQPASESPLQTARVGLICFVAASFFAWIANNAAVAVASSSMAGILVLSSVLFPIAAGLITGLLSRTRHGYGALLGCGGAALLCAVIASFEGDPQVYGVQRFPFVALAASQVVFWLPLAAVAGAFGGSLRKGARKALLHWATRLV